MDLSRLFAKSGHRIIDKLRPKRRAVGMRSYLMARWRRKEARCGLKFGHKPRTEEQRGWMPGRWRLDGLQAPRRVINPAVRFIPQNRIYNEIVRAKQGAYPPPYLWAKRIPLTRAD